MPRFNLQRFLGETGLSLARLASYLQVAQTYLREAAEGKVDLTRRDREACRTLWRRLTQAVQIELPFAEPPSTFTRGHARLVARSRAKTPRGRPTGAAARSERRPATRAASARGQASESRRKRGAGGRVARRSEGR
ncbi:MAG TPA: hypothetical protein VLH58_04905 [Candidatus Methylomirabilis sp.]|nr:hypothetical protein [Candidatus Methylomirabilis sp.]HSC70668.1 hypothetical protein [Candidatus Methylomirabilis sp.]